ncbi:MAG: hypothetical protein WC655_20410 [Candidatus Hydrogenedentales bacterium]|jgi:hypothetical protein
MPDDEDADSQGPFREGERCGEPGDREDGELPSHSQRFTFTSGEAFRRLLARYHGSVGLAAQAIGVEEETLRAWLRGAPGRKGREEDGN